jgi:hypothetical protein
MNNRIKELEPQCWEHNEFGLNFNYEKFAELIIRECAKVVDSLTSTPGYGEVDYWAEGIDLLQHFGVEE